MSMTPSLGVAQMMIVVPGCGCTAAQYAGSGGIPERVLPSGAAGSDPASEAALGFVAEAAAEAAPLKGTGAPALAGDGTEAAVPSATTTS